MPDRTGAILGSEADRRRSPSACWMTHACWSRRAVPCWPSPAIPPTIFLDRVQEQVGVPILHMIRETARLPGQPGPEAARHPGYRWYHPDRSLPAGVCCPGAGARGPGPEAKEQIMS